MKTATSVCGRCGTKIYDDANRKACPACLLETGLGLLDDDFLAEVVDPGRDDGLPVLDRRKAAPPAKMLSDFGDYELLEEIGRGGQGVVYRAHQKSLNRMVALKVVGLGPWTTERHLKRFRREAEAAASLDHPGIVPIYEVGERDGQCYFSMKFVEDGELDEVLKRELIPIRHAVELIAKIARTVHYAHEHGILHRDIKPGNILLDGKGEPHLTDFGLARLVETESTVTRTLEVLGTPSYMAPEQAVGSNSALTTTTDVYGLGAVLYQLLTGHPPFAGGTTYETIKLLLDTEPRQPRLLNPKIDRDLSTICLKCLEKEPQCRYSSALALAQDLEHWLKREPIRARHSGVFTRGSKWARRNPAIAALIGSLVALAAALGWNVWKSEPVSSTYPRSIAVLPFENLSRDPDNASFADGMQDAVLTDLARIADLKVISRASVMQYKSGVARNLREIGQRLGVAYVVEGTVQRSGNLVRVDAQLIDTRTDKQVWAEVYDRDLVSVFGVESSIATTIADHLHAKLSSGEKSEIERTPTTNIAAFDLYTRAKNILLEAQMHTKAELLLAVDLLNQAVAHDPSFFDAYCELGYAHDRIYWTGAETTPARLALADTAIKAAARLRPDVGETHLARAQNLYWGYLDYDGALVELEVARRTLPNDFRVPRLMAAINRRQGDWEGSTRNLERCLELSPRDLESLDGLYTNYLLLRRYAEAKSALDRYIALRPDNVAGSRLLQACLEFQEKADIWPLHQRLDSIRATNPAEMQSSGGFWLVCAFAERDATAAKNALDACVDFRSGSFGSVVFLSRSMLEGLVARMTKDEAKARSAFVAAHAEQQRVVQAQPDNSRELSLLGLIDAALGRKEEALREGRRAVELLPVKKDPIVGVDMVVNLAIIAAWVGDKDLACEQLDSIIRRPGWLNNYGELKLLPWWDPLRGDPRFERLLEEAKQPVALN